MSLVALHPAGCEKSRTWCYVRAAAPTTAAWQLPATSGGASDGVVELVTAEPPTKGSPPGVR